jgi:Ca-activated chloride channel family protein
MNLLLPLGLLALASVPLIVVIHLLRERRRRLVVASLALWRRIAPPQPRDRRVRWPRWWRLLLHLLIAGALALALAQPVFAGWNLVPARHLAIVIDTSASMAAREGNTSRIAEARRRAAELVRASGGADRVTVIAAGAVPRIVAEGDAGEGVLAALATVEAGGAGCDLAAALALAEAALTAGFTREIVVFSDGGATPVPRRVGVPLRWEAVGGDPGNRAITHFAVRRGPAEVAVFAHIVNDDDRPLATVARLTADGVTLRRENLGIAPRSATDLAWTVRSSAATLSLVLDGADALPADDVAYARIGTPAALEVVLVSPRPEVMLRALAAVPGLTVRAVAPADAAPPAGSALVVYDGWLPTAWPDAGAILVVNPPAGGTLLGVGAGVAPGAAPVTAAEPFGGILANSADLGGVVALEVPPWADVLMRADDHPLIVRGSVDGRTVMVWAFDPAAGALATRLAFPILVGRAVRALVARATPDQVGVAEPFVITASVADAGIRIVDADARTVAALAPGTRTIDGIATPGIYHIEARLGETWLALGTVAVNAGDPREARLVALPAPDIAAPERDVAAPVRPQPQPWWPWLVGLALAALLVDWWRVPR